MSPMSPGNTLPGLVCFPMPRTGRTQIMFNPCPTFSSDLGQQKYPLNACYFPCFSTCIHVHVHYISIDKLVISRLAMIM